jgi:hypothetical protein
MHAQSVLVLSKERFSAQKICDSRRNAYSKHVANLVSKKKCLLRKIKLRRNQNVT